ncbi:TOMM precursor leader peptide-binding protein [Corynebacterium sp. 4HC-13]|uniref:TOMM precursor leader peptide-binding protein n=1 Tax=Corynebacterium anserum TaxID=2684406 RepID=UPI00163B1AD5|nr:TOMM precursor leader peptide-binding protein [Corynebacterium anserum]MBC2682073.1 TOMM precursor leader peptide-binding protein [Corynebacterium anserum]
MAIHCQRRTDTHSDLKDSTGHLVQLARGTALITRPGIGIQFNTLPGHAIILPLPKDVRTGAVLTALASARLPTTTDQLATSLGFCGFSNHIAVDIIEELLRAGVLRRHIPHCSVSILRTGHASERLTRALSKQGVDYRVYDSPHALVHNAPTGTTAVLPGTLFPHSDLVYMLMQARIPHLTSAAMDGYAIVGPLVVPGHTACLNCLDTHYEQQDAGWKSIRLQATGRPMSADPLNGDIAALATASLITAHILPWMAAGSPHHAIPTIALCRVDYRLEDSLVKTHPPIPRWRDCMSCQMAAVTPHSA